MLCQVNTGILQLIPEQDSLIGVIADECIPDFIHDLPFPHDDPHPEDNDHKHAKQQEVSCSFHGQFLSLE